MRREAARRGAARGFAAAGREASRGVPFFFACVAWIRVWLIRFVLGRFGLVGGKGRFQKGGGVARTGPVQVGRTPPDVYKASYAATYPSPSPSFFIGPTSSSTQRILPPLHESPPAAEGHPGLRHWWIARKAWKPTSTAPSKVHSKFLALNKKDSKPSASHSIPDQPSS